METRLIPVFFRNLTRVRARERWSRQRILAFQAANLRRVRAYAVANSPFYRTFHRGLENAPLEALPPLTKLTMMANFDEIVVDRGVRLREVRQHMAREAETGRPYLGRYQVTTSSGSSGEVSVVLSTQRESVYQLAVASRERAFARLPWNPLRPRRVAEVVGMLPWLASAQTARIQRSRLAPLLHLGAGQPLDQLVAQLNAWQPEILEGYTSIIGLLAGEQIAGRLQIRPRMIGTGGETMNAEIKRRIRAAWGSGPFDFYGTVEAGTHAVECREGRRMHIMDDALVLEVVDDDGRPVPPGETGARTLVTPLWRMAQPLIRYEIADRVRLSRDERCACGRPFGLIEEIQGRAPNLVSLPAAAGSGDVAIPSMAFAIVASVPALWRRLKQEDDRLILDVVGLPDEFDTEPVIAGISRALAEHGARPTRVEIRRLAEIPRTAAGKALVEQGGPPRAAGPSGTAGPAGALDPGADNGSS